MIAGHCARSDSSQFLLPFHGSVLQNRDQVACQYARNVLYWSLAHNCRENQNDCIILLTAQAQCAELFKWPTYLNVYLAFCTPDFRTVEDTASLRDLKINQSINPCPQLFLSKTSVKWELVHTGSSHYHSAVRHPRCVSTTVSSLVY